MRDDALGLASGARVATAFRLKDGCEGGAVLLGRLGDEVATAFRLKDGCEKAMDGFFKYCEVATAFRLKDGCEYIKKSG